MAILRHTNVVMLRRDNPSKKCVSMTERVSRQIMLECPDVTVWTIYFYCKLVVVSSVSSNHLSEATEMIVSVQRYMPSTRLIMYSLGLTSGEMELLRSYCNVELQIFDFDKYPTLAYSKNHLRTFGWKPVVVKEVSEQYEVMMYFDSSVRLNGPISEKVLKYLWSSPAFIAGPWIGNGCYKSNKPIVSFTHDATLQYLFQTHLKVSLGSEKNLP